MKKDSPLLKEIQALVAANELEAAIQLLLHQYGDRELLLMLSSQYYSIKEGLQQGLTDYAESQKQLNLIRTSLLQFVKKHLDTPAQSTDDAVVVKDNYKQSIARLCILQLLYKDSPNEGLSITELYKQSKVKSRRYIATSILELESCSFVERNKKDKIILWKLTAAGLQLAEELKHSILFDT